MATLDFHLFRAKFIKSKQPSLFNEDLSPGNIFLKAIFEKPSIQIQTRYTWHIGNVEKIDSEHGYFAVGRTTKSVIEKYDETSKNFIEEEYEESPYTHVLYNLKYGLLAISKKTKLAPTVNGIARKISTLFDSTNIVKDFDVNVEIDYLRDPESFLILLKKAYSIKKFSATFGGPNPFDADENFQKPLSVYLKKANGKKGKAEIQGSDLDQEVLHEVTKAVASTGNDATAKIQNEKGDKLSTIYLGENQVNLKVDEAEFEKKDFSLRVDEEYKKLRSS